MNIQPTTIPDVLLITPRIFGDNRGFFIETYQSQRYAEAGIDAQFVQDNHSGSSKGILRGLHYQIRQTQGKLVRVIAGEVFDAAVDMRRGSPTFGRWAGARLSSENHCQLWVPPGFAHGFYVLSDWAEVLYKTTDYYAPEWERTLLWNDPTVHVDWPLENQAAPVLSAKDSQGCLFQDAEYFD